MSDVIIPVRIIVAAVEQQQHGGQYQKKFHTVSPYVVPRRSPGLIPAFVFQNADCHSPIIKRRIAW